MENQWAGFDDFELACLYSDYGFTIAPDDIVEILPVRLKDRAKIEQILTEYEFDRAFGKKDVDLIPELL